MSQEEKTTITVVPALPGFDVVELCENGQRPDEFDYIPVVAWVVHIYDDGHGHAAGSHTEPVCADQNFYRGRRRQIIRQPDGSILFPCDRKFNKGQEAEALAYAVRLREPDQVHGE